MSEDDAAPARAIPASGFGALLPVRLVERTAQRMVLEFDIAEHHRNRAGAVHGGALMTLMDIACGQVGIWAESSAAPARAATVSLSANFILPALRGPLHITARNLGGGRTLFYADCEIVDADGKLCATGQASFRRFKGDAPAVETSGGK
jgi:uncharacterized protein (TIGR00369 family)